MPLKRAPKRAPAPTRPAHVLALNPATGKRTRPATWEPEVDGVTQPCWCGEMFCDNHEDGNHSDVSVE